MNNIQLNINLTFNQLLQAAKQLSPKEKLMLNDAIWDERIKIAVKQQVLILLRKQAAEENPDNRLEWNEASKKLTS